MPPDKPKKIALVHDFFYIFGGAERVFRALADLYPEAPIYTLLADPELIRRHFPGREIHTTFIQKLPAWLRRRPRLLLPLYAVAIETIDLRDFDIVISSSGAWAKGIVTRLHTRHIAYLHSPMRFVWDATARALGGGKGGGAFHFLARLVLAYLRVWDRQAADRPDTLLANSEYTAERVKKYYRREAAVVPPPALGLFENFGASVNLDGERQGFLVVARLSKSKQLDIVIEAFNKLELPLMVVGTGPEEKTLQKLAGSHITFMGEIDDAALARAYAGARALIQPSEEDFGLVAVEALSFGTPVIAYGEGGAREVIEPGVTGEFFAAETPEVLADGVRRFTECEPQYSQEKMRTAAERYSTPRFQTAMREIVEITLRD